MEKIGVRELRQHASRWLARVAAGESFEVTDRGQPVAWLVPTGKSTRERLMAAGQLIPANGDLLEIRPLRNKPPLSSSLEELRAEERWSLLYVDSSALVKLVVTELETAALRRYLRTRPDRVTSELSAAEVLRAALRRDPELIDAARRTLYRIDRIALGSQLVERAGTLTPRGMRTLDALHIASALEIGEELEALVAYDHRLLEGAVAQRLPTVSPA
jgi:uncharacterized protein